MSFSNPSVRAIGFVVSVKRELPIISIISLMPIKQALYIPSTVIFRNFHDQITSPSIIKMFKRNVNARIIIIGFIPRKINESGTFDKATTMARAIPQITKPRKFFTKNNSTIKMIADNIFVLGSSL